MSLLTSMWIAWGAAGGSGLLAAVLVLLALRDLAIARAVIAHWSQLPYGR